MTGPAAPEDNSRFDDLMRQQLFAWGWDINEPYSPLEYLEDLQLVATAAPDARDPRTAWRDPETGEQHVLTVNADHLLLRVYQQLIERHGRKKGGSRALRSAALMAFRQRHQTQLHAAGLDWMNPACGEADRKLRWLDFLLQHPVRQSQQWKPDAIPETAIAGFLADEPRAG